MALWRPGVFISACAPQSIARGPHLPGALCSSLCTARCAPFGLGTWKSLTAVVYLSMSQSLRVPGSDRPGAPACPPRHASEVWASRDRPLLPRPLQTSALRCACAFGLLCLRLLGLLRPDGAVGEEVQVPQRLRPRAARWLPNFGQFNKYIEKLCNSRWAGRKGGGGEETDTTCPRYPTLPHPTPCASQPGTGLAEQPPDLCEDVFPSVKSKNAKNSNDASNPKNTPPANATKPLSANATKLPRQNTTNPPPWDAAKPRPGASSRGRR